MLNGGLAGDTPRRLHEFVRPQPHPRPCRDLDPEQLPLPQNPQRSLKPLSTGMVFRLATCDA